MDKISGNSSSNNNRTKTIATVAGVLSASVLAYCGYKIVDNKLKKSKYEPDPNKNVQNKK